MLMAAAKNDEMVSACRDWGSQTRPPSNKSIFWLLSVRNKSFGFWHAHSKHKHSSSSSIIIHEMILLSNPRASEGNNKIPQGNGINKSFMRRAIISRNTCRIQRSLVLFFPCFFSLLFFSFSYIMESYFVFYIGVKRSKIKIPQRSTVDASCRST